MIRVGDKRMFDHVYGKPSNNLRVTFCLYRCRTVLIKSVFCTSTHKFFYSSGSSKLSVSNTEDEKFVNTEYWYTKWGMDGRNKTGLQPNRASIKAAFSSTVVAMMRAPPLLLLSPFFINSFAVVAYFSQTDLEMNGGSITINSNTPWQHSLMFVGSL